MRFLAKLSFTVSRQDDGNPIVVMNLNHDAYNVNYTGQCPYSIQEKIVVLGLDTPQYKAIRALAYDIFRSIMIELTKLLNPQPDCVCLAIWNIPPPVEYKAITNASIKRKHDDVEY
jgi:hypothetical protein